MGDTYTATDISRNSYGVTYEKPSTDPSPFSASLVAENSKLRIRASQSDAQYEESVEKHGRSQKVILSVSIAFTMLTMLSSEFFWFFPILEDKTNKTSQYWVPHTARWVEWKVFICIETVILIMSIGALIATRNIRNLEAHIVVVIMGFLTFCCVLSTTNSAILATILMNGDRNGQKLPTEDGESLHRICVIADGILAGGQWWSDYYAGKLPSSALSPAEYEMMKKLQNPFLAGSVMSWTTIACNAVASCLFLCSCQMGFFALP